MADKVKDNEILVAIESGSGLLDSGEEVRWARGKTRVRADSAIARKWPFYFVRDGATEDEVAAARAPLHARVNALAEKTDAAFRREQARNAPLPIAEERAVEVIHDFTVGLVLYPEGTRFDRDDELVKKHPEFFGTPRRPLA
jgi:hypothetical protein